MDQHAESILWKRLERTAENLRRNRMEAYLLRTAAEVPGLVKTLAPEGAVAASGGSMSLAECGVMDLLRSGRYRYLDREGKTGDEIRDVYLGAFQADVYFSSANAVTESGELYNVDGNSNRIAAIAYGPKSVIIVAGANKVVKDLTEAVRRVKITAAPANVSRLNCQTYCAESGVCMSPDGNMGAGCHGDGRICCNALISAQQRIPNRIKVILTAESLGY